MSLIVPFEGCETSSPVYLVIVGHRDRGKVLKHLLWIGVLTQTVLVVACNTNNDELAQVCSLSVQAGASVPEHAFDDV